MSVDKVKISIIVPVYNVEHYLRECLDSLISQTLKEIEIICINDASPDGSLRILEEYAELDSRIVIINLKENKRQGGARNAGINVAKGTYIGFVDSDDWVESDMYEKLWDASREGEVDMVTNTNYYFNKQNSLSTIQNIPEHILGLSKNELNKYTILHGGRLWTNMFKKTLFLDYQLFFPEKLVYEDNAIAAPLYCLAKTYSFITQPKYHYRYRVDSTTQSKQSVLTLADMENVSLFDRLPTSEIFLENMKRLGFYSSYKEECDYRFYSLYYRGTVLGCLFNFTTIHKPYIKYIRKEFSKHMKISDNAYYLTSRFETKNDIFLFVLDYNISFAVFMFKLIRKIKGK